MGEFVSLEVEDAVATIRLTRPKMNAISLGLQADLRAATAEINEREEIRAVVIWGGERVFAAGNDVKEMTGLSHAEMVKHSALVQGTINGIARIPKPVIAAINGYALGGGCELALAADFRVAAEDAVLGQPEVLLGVIPGAGGTQRLPRLVGPAKAKDLIFSGRFVKAAEALEIGLVDRIAPADQTYATALEWARTFTTGAPLALRAAKECVDRGMATDLESGLEMERQQFAGLFATEDLKHGMASFVEHGPGKATFTGR